MSVIMAYKVEGHGWVTVHRQGEGEGLTDENHVLVCLPRAVAEGLAGGPLLTAAEIGKTWKLFSGR